MPLPLSRRQVLRLGAAAVAGAATTPLASTARAASSPSRPKNIIFMVSDGMSVGVPVLAETFSQLIGRGETNWHALASRKGTVHGMFDMGSLNSLVTDSSAASSSWGSGSRIDNRAVNYLPDGTRLQPIAHAVKESGRAMGLVTTATVTHATPAGFAAAVEIRDDEPGIAPQYLGLVDVVMGGGLGFFDPNARKDKRDLLAEYRKAGYALLTERGQLKSAQTESKLLGLFDPHYLPFTVDWNSTPELQKQVPTLAEMSALALNSLKQRKEGFFIQIEGARIDHAAHANDSAGIVWDQLAFDEALGVVLTFIRDNPDTLLIVTADHGNSNPGLNGMGGGYSQSNECFARLRDFRSSTLKMQSDLQKVAKINKTVKSEEVLSCVKAGTGLELSKGEGEALAEALNSKSRILGNKQHANFVGLLGEFTGNYTGIGWTGTTHTSDYTKILAAGPGADAYQGLLRNTASYDRLTAFMGVTHKNPSMTAEEAAKYKKVASAQTNAPSHWMYREELGGSEGRLA